MLIHASKKIAHPFKEPRVKASDIFDVPRKVQLKIFHKTGILTKIVERLNLDRELELFKDCKVKIRSL